jgi:RNA polymerase sigma factor (sigma-70 family)
VFALQPQERKRVASFEEYYGGHFDRVARVAYLVGGPTEAFDIAQEAFARTWTSWDHLSERENPLFFTLRVVTNLARTRARRAGVLRRCLSLVGRGALTAAESNPEARLGIEAALRALPHQQRAAIVLVYLCGCSVAESAQILEIAPSTLRVHLSRAMPRLRTLLSDEDEAST